MKLLSLTIKSPTTSNYTFNVKTAIKGQGPGGVLHNSEENKDQRDDEWRQSQEE